MIPVVLKGDVDEAIKRTETALRRFRDFEVLEPVGQRVEFNIQRSFEEAESPDGEAWPLKTDGSRATLGEIRDTSYARRSGRTKIMYGVRHGLASYHQDGGGVAPQRSFVPNDENADELVDEVGNIIEEYLGDL